MKPFTIKAFTILYTLYFIAGTQAATNYLIKAGAGNQCEAPDTYNQCIDNALVTNCSPTDNLCNCKQAEILVACVNYCTKDPRIAGLGVSQQSEVTKWCNAATSASVSPSSTLMSSASDIKSTSPQTTASATMSQAPAKPSNGAEQTKQSSAGRAELSLGLVGIAGLISYVI